MTTNTHTLTHTDLLHPPRWKGNSIPVVRFLNGAHIAVLPIVFSSESPQGDACRLQVSGVNCSASVVNFSTSVVNFSTSVVKYHRGMHADCRSVLSTAVPVLSNPTGGPHADYRKHTHISLFSGYIMAFLFPATQLRASITVLDLFYSSHRKYS
jgi:hypothetical protein